MRYFLYRYKPPHINIIRNWSVAELLLCSGNEGEAKLRSAQENPSSLWGILLVATYEIKKNFQMLYFLSLAFLGYLSKHPKNRILILPAKAIFCNTVKILCWFFRKMADGFIKSFCWWSFSLLIVKCKGPTGELHLVLHFCLHYFLI